MSAVPNVLSAAHAVGGLQVAGLAVRFGERRGLTDIALNVAAGERVALVGPSGVGKTSLLRTLAGLIPAAGGSIVVNGRAVEAALPERRGIVYLHQSPGLFPHLSVLDNVAFPMRLRGTDADEARTKARQLLERVDLAALGARHVAALSGGQKHRVALARALAAAPAVLLLDEPFAALDPALRGEVRDAVVALLDVRGPAVVIVTHDVDEAAQFAHRMAVLMPSGLAQVDAVETVLRRPTSMAVARFLGLPNLVSGTVDAAGCFVSALGTLAGVAGRAPRGGATMVGAADALSARRAADGAGIVVGVHTRVQGSVATIRVGQELLMAIPAPDEALAANDRVAVTVSAHRMWVLPQGTVQPAAGEPQAPTGVAADV